MNREQAASQDEPITLRPAWRVIISVLVSLHVLAVFAAPYSLPPTSELADRMWQFFQPYLQTCYLNHGYAFFAPDPGPSHLIRYELEMPDGEVREGRFPNLAEQNPRLLYHRHFMLTEYLTIAPQNVPWRKAYVRSYAEHLLHAHQASRVSLYHVEHLIPFPDQVLEGMPLDDPSLYRETFEITLSADGTAEWPPAALRPLEEQDPEVIPVAPPAVGTPDRQPDELSHSLRSGAPAMVHEVFAVPSGPGASL